MLRNRKLWLETKKRMMVAILCASYYMAANSRLSPYRSEKSRGCRNIAVVKNAAYSMDRTSKKKQKSKKMATEMTLLIRIRKGLLEFLDT